MGYSAWETKLEVILWPLHMFTHKRTCAVPSLTQTHIHTSLVPNNLNVLKILLEEGKGAIGQEKVVKREWKSGWKVI